MDDPLLRMAGLPGMRSLGNGPLPDDGVDRTPTERYLYNTVELYNSKTWSKDFLSTDGRVRYLERSNLAPLSTNKGTFLGLPCDHKDEWGMCETHFTGPSVTRFIPCGQKMAYYFNGHGCSPNWLLRGLMLLLLPIREIIYEHVVHYDGLLSWVTTNDYYGVPTLEDKIKITTCHAMGEFCWIRGFAEALRRRENDGSQEAKEVLIDFLGFLIPSVVWSMKCCNQRWKSDLNVPIIESLLLNDSNNERESITHILTPSSKLWGYTDDIDDDAYISVQYMEGWLSYTDDIADDAYISLQFMEGWNEKPLKPPRFRNIKKFRKLLRLQRYQLPRQIPPNQLVPQQNIRRAEQAAFRNLLPGDGWPRSIWYQMKSAFKAGLNPEIQDFLGLVSSLEEVPHNYYQM
ncbi:hypothetical protein BTUL_0147g00090 [Botrytis tulipae]|uniref:Uncharacterized protein n=1 Tax=Botrytis tulipae TaxID=87230 RepID=A0A4Z1ECM9_9HELO|nr:hypothetical protein BTUL_0147g00090 [Botrytis tulipae]